MRRWLSWMVPDDTGLDDGGLSRPRSPGGELQGPAILGDGACDVVGGAGGDLGLDFEGDGDLGVDDAGEVGDDLLGENAGGASLWRSCPPRLAPVAPTLRFEPPPRLPIISCSLDYRIRLTNHTARAGRIT
jgi:hypothetical protein